jgi:hypothetical protein
MNAVGKEDAFVCREEGVDAVVITHHQHGQVGQGAQLLAALVELAHGGGDVQPKLVPVLHLPKEALQAVVEVEQKGAVRGAPH